MAETHDTIDGLLAEFRGHLAGLPANYHFTVSCHDIRVMLDRFEAAHKRELSKTASKNWDNFGQFGDAAKLREEVRALLAFAELNLQLSPDKLKEGARECCEYVALCCKSALAAPARNCDVGTAEDQAKMMDAYCASHGKRIDDSWRCDNCPLCSVDRCDLTWAQMPYEGGGAV